MRWWREVSESEFVGQSITPLAQASREQATRTYSGPPARPSQTSRPQATRTPVAGQPRSGHPHPRRRPAASKPPAHTAGHPHPGQPPAGHPHIQRATRTYSGPPAPRPPHRRPPHRRPPARGGPTIDDPSTGGTNTTYIVGPPLAGLHGEVFGWIGLGSRWRSVPNATLSVGLSSDFTTNFPKKPPRVSPLRVACRALARASVHASGGGPTAAFSSRLWGLPPPAVRETTPTIAGTLVAEADMQDYELQDLAEQVGNLTRATVGLTLRLHLHIEPGPTEQISDETLAKVNEIMAEVSEKLKLERR